MTKIQNVTVSNIDYLNLRFICNLMLEFWDFIIFVLIEAKLPASKIALIFIQLYKF